jgi:hypothetical protein
MAAKQQSAGKAATAKRLASLVRSKNRSRRAAAIKEHHTSLLEKPGAPPEGDAPGVLPFI